MRDEVLAEVVRGNLVECEHRGSFALLDSRGGVSASLGDVEAPMFPRSSVKPIQAVAMLRNGLELEPRLLALAAASHSGSAWHVAGVQEILASHGRTAADLQCPEGWPLSSSERDAWAREGGQPDRLHFNCSGKHAGFIATSAINHWHIASYLEPDHPMQRAVVAAIEELAEVRATQTTVDGCGAPLFAISLVGLARAFRTIAMADAHSAEGQVAASMYAYPDMVGGAGRDDTVVMQRMFGLIAKGGAEGVFSMALRDGRALAVKVSDGAVRGYQPLLRAVLRGWGLAEDVVSELPAPSVLGGGRVVGRVRLSTAATIALA